MQSLNLVDLGCTAYHEGRSSAGQRGQKHPRTGSSEGSPSEIPDYCNWAAIIRRKHPIIKWICGAECTSQLASETALSAGIGRAEMHPMEIFKNENDG